LLACGRVFFPASDGDWHTSRLPELGESVQPQIAPRCGVHRIRTAVAAVPGRRRGSPSLGPLGHRGKLLNP
jgi:hypothetical protein